MPAAWRNQLCDVLVAWSHAFHKWDYLVTSDKDFHDHKHELKEVGVNGIVYPKDAADLVTPNQSLRPTAGSAPEYPDRGD